MAGTLAGAVRRCWQSLLHSTPALRQRPASGKLLCRFDYEDLLTPQLPFHMRFSIMYQPSAAALLASALTALSANAVAAPFRVAAETDLRADYRSHWSAYSTSHAEVMPDFAAVPTTDPGRNLLVRGVNDTLSIWNSPGRNQPGVLMNHTGSGTAFLYPDHEIQGFGVTIESASSEPTTFHLDVFEGNGSFIHSESVTVPDGSVPTFLSLVDPETRIGIVGLRTSTSGPFTFSDASVQLRWVVQTDADQLPATGEQTVIVESTETYLNQGYGNPQADPATDIATEVNDNAHDLRAWFPTLRAGDVLALERLGSPLDVSGSPNHLLGVFSSTQQLLSGTESRRIPGAIKAGVDFYTPPVTGKFNVVTSSNLQEDFIIGSRSLVVFPSKARYLFLTRARQDPAATPMAVRASHIPREVFGAWISDYGFVGSLADPNSDLDGDGLTLLEEFAFMKDPTVADAGTRADYSFAPFVDRDFVAAGRLQMLFGARTDGPIRISAEFSSDMKHWQRLPDSAIVTALTDPSSPRAVFSVTDPAGGPRRFSRLVIDQLPPPAP